LKNSAILTAILAYMASEDPEKTKNIKVQGIKWPEPVKANRRGGLDK